MWNYSGYVIPKGWKVVCAIREAHQDPAYFENPSEFNPWRHEQVNGQQDSQLTVTSCYVFDLVFEFFEVKSKLKLRDRQ